jgi:hypothetical protein
MVAWECPTNPREASGLDPEAVHVLPRESTQEVAIDGYRVPDEVPVWLGIRQVQRDERFYDDPDTFHPSRWDETIREEIPDFAYAPFGGGPRLCIGRQFALTEMKLALAIIGRQHQSPRCRCRRRRAKRDRRCRGVPGMSVHSGRVDSVWSHECCRSSRSLWIVSRPGTTRRTRECRRVRYPSRSYWIRYHTPAFGSRTCRRSCHGTLKTRT